MTIKDHFLFCNEGRIRVRDLTIQDAKKDAPVLVFLHDALGCIESWKAFPEQVCSALKMNGVIYDRAGHGKSDASKTIRPIDYLEQEALDVLPVILNQLRIENPILIGCSDGASIALLYGMTFPTSAIVSIAGHIRVEDITISGIKNMLGFLKEEMIFRKLEKLHDIKTQRLIDDWAEVWLSKAFRDWDISGSLELIQCPVLVIQGEHDEYASPEHCLDIGNGIGSNARIEFIEKSGHFPHLESMLKVVRIIEQFLVN